MTLENNNKIIFALDVDSADEALALIEELHDEVYAFKIGLQLFSAAGPAFVRQVANDGNRVFLDVKFHDIPNTVAKASIEVAKLGVWMFNMHASGGAEMMTTAAEAVAQFCGKNDLVRPKILGVTVLTSMDDDGLAETGINAEAADQVMRLALLAKKSGLDGVVASPLESAQIREAVGDEAFLIVTPGVRPTFATINDQKRVTSPGDAVLCGSDYVVVGRPISEAPDRGNAAKLINEEIRIATSVT